MGRLIRQDDEIDDGSSSAAVDEGRRAVAVDDIVGEESPAGGGREADGGVWGFAGFGGLGVRMGGTKGKVGGAMA